MAAQSFLLTRPAAASARFSAALTDSFGANLRIVISPLMGPVFLNPMLPPGPFDAVILTSETGAEAARRISAEQRSLPTVAFCVGDRTALVAAEAGFQPVSAKGDADDLLALIRARLPRARLVYLRGEDSRGDLADQLNSSGIETVQAVVYRQVPRPLTVEAKGLLAGNGPVLLPLFSPRSADLLRDTGPIRAPLWVAALSSAVAERAALLLPEKLEVATHPNAFEMLKSLHCLWVAGRQT